MMKRKEGVGLKVLPCPSETGGKDIAGRKGKGSVFESITELTKARNPQTGKPFKRRT